MKARLCLLFFLFFCSSLFGNAFQIDRFEVKKVMNQLFEYHVDKKEISTLIFERSLKSYINSFDSEKIYLLHEETIGFLNPSGQLTQKMLAEYNGDQFSVYFEINKRIENGIKRARAWRYEWEKAPYKLIEEAKLVKIEKTAEDKNFSYNVKDLKDRYYEFFLKVIAVELKIFNSSLTTDKYEPFIALCERRIAHIENPYLGINEEGLECSTKEKEHLVYLRTLKSLAQSLDAHTAYYSPEEAFAMRVQLEKGMCGIGVVLHESIEGVTIAEMIKGGPAESGGKLQVGDTIIEVNGASINNFSFKKVLEILRGEEGSKLSLGILRSYNGKEVFQRVEIVRSKITIDDKRVDVSYELFGDGIIGKITLYSFYEGEDGISSEKDIRKAISELKQHGPLYGLVLDLRENSGGFLSQAVKVSSLFISSGVVVISKYSDGKLKFYRSVEGNRFYDGPLVVLISKGSASATEIVAQTLQDYGVAVIVGDDHTYGKGSIQHQTVTSDKSPSFFKVTIGKYYTVSGKSTQIEGVKADIVVPTEYNFEKMGEGHLEFPLPADKINPCFQDTLSDLDPYARKWFSKFYLPNLQPKVAHWHSMIGTLRENSTNRVEQNKNFNLFLKKIKKEGEKEELSFGSNDLQMEESVNIIKDMIFLEQKNRPEIKIAS